MWVILNYVCWSILGLNFIWGLTRTIKKRVIYSMMISRLFYWLIMISQVVIGLRSFHRHIGLVIIGAAITLIVIALSENAFNRKQEINGQIPRLLWPLIMLSLAGVLIQTMVNF